MCRGRLVRAVTLAGGGCGLGGTGRTLTVQSAQVGSSVYAAGSPDSISPCRCRSRASATARSTRTSAADGHRGSGSRRPRQTTSSVTSTSRPPPVSGVNITCSSAARPARTTSRRWPSCVHQLRAAARAPAACAVRTSRARAGTSSKPSQPAPSSAADPSPGRPDPRVGRIGGSVAGSVGSGGERHVLEREVVEREGAVHGVDHVDLRPRRSSPRSRSRRSRGRRSRGSPSRSGPPRRRPRAASSRAGLPAFTRASKPTRCIGLENVIDEIGIRAREAPEVASAADALDARLARRVVLVVLRRRAGGQRERRRRPSWRRRRRSRAPRSSKPSCVADGVKSPKPDSTVLGSAKAGDVPTHGAESAVHRSMAALRNDLMERPPRPVVRGDRERGSDSTAGVEESNAGVAGRATTRRRRTKKRNRVRHVRLHLLQTAGLGPPPHSSARRA